MDDFGLSYGAPPLSRQEETHALILDETIGLIERIGEENVTMRAVAEWAGVTERTVYRHFKSRDLLLLSARERMVELVGPPTIPTTADELVEKPREWFPRLEQERNLVRAFLYSAARREDCKARDRQSQEKMVACFGDELEQLDEHSLRRRAAIAEVITSAYAWDLMRVRWGLSAREAGQAAAEALEILLNRRSPTDA